MKSKHPFCAETLDLIDVGILIIDGQNINFANTAFAQIVGIPAENLHGRSLRELGGDAWIDFTLGQSWADALPWPMPDGSDRWFEVSMKPLNFDGRTVQVASCADVTSRMRAEGAEASMLQMLTEIIEGYPVGTFVIDREHQITHWNRACEVLCGLLASDVVGTAEAWRAFSTEPRQLLADWVMDTQDEAYLRTFGGTLWRSPAAEGAYEAEILIAQFGEQPARWLHVAASPLRDAMGTVIGAIETLIDITPRKEAEEKLRRAHESAEHLVTERTRELREAKSALEDDISRRMTIEEEMQRRLIEVTELNCKLHDTQDRLVQSQQQLVQNEKLASIGQLAAGVAHEINNPIGYVFSNLGSLQSYLADILALLEAYVAAEPELANASTRESLAALRKKKDLDYVKGDLMDLMRESREGIERVRKIVQDLKDFSHVDASSDWQWTDLHRGLDSTLNVVNNEIKYKADVIRNYGQQPQVQCLPSQLNQVFMNLLINAAQAISSETRGTIHVSSGADDDEVWIEIADDGCGMPPEVVGRIFDPFFTTKPVGKGTGLGLSLSYGIIQKHHGRIEVRSAPGEGTAFRIVLPVQQPEASGEASAQPLQEAN
jgi:two-component system NtrC family sensor kinase